MLRSLSAIQRGCFESRYVRQVMDAAFRAHCRYHHAHFDRLNTARSQAHTLTALVHRAQSTRFGREHDFRRIRTAEDFRRLVPLTTAAELWRDRWEPALPHLNGATWPGAIALKGSPTAPLPCTTELLDASRAAYRTMLASIADARPRGRLLSGQIIFVGDDLPVWQRGLNSSDRLNSVPSIVRPYSSFSSAGDDSSLTHLAEKSRSHSATVITGSIDRIFTLFELVKQQSGRDRIEEIWPSLTAVVYSHTRPNEGMKAILQSEVPRRHVVARIGVSPRRTDRARGPTLRHVATAARSWDLFRVYPCRTSGNSQAGPSRDWRNRAGSRLRNCRLDPRRSLGLSPRLRRPLRPTGSASPSSGRNSSKAHVTPRRRWRDHETGVSTPSTKRRQSGNAARNDLP